MTTDALRWPEQRETESCDCTDDWASVLLKRIVGDRDHSLREDWAHPFVGARPSRCNGLLHRPQTSKNSREQSAVVG